MQGFNKDILLLADSGYQGITDIHPNSWIPNKKSKYKDLTKEEKAENRRLSKLRILIEHMNRRLKRFKILSARYRNKRKRHSLRVSLLCGICNYEIS